jgi:hypothetical protein
MAKPQYPDGPRHRHAVPMRALTVEQLNAGQWHVVASGLPVPERSLEGCGSGVTSFGEALEDALSRSRLTGLPVTVQAKGSAPRWLTRDEMRLRRRLGAATRRPTLSEILDSPAGYAA